MNDYFVPFEERPKMNFSICTKYDSQFSSYEGIYLIKIGDEYYVWKTNSASVIEKPVLETSSTQDKNSPHKVETLLSMRIWPQNKQILMHRKQLKQAYIKNIQELLLD